VLELLAGEGWHDPDDVVRQVASEAGLSEDEARAALGDVWKTFDDSGLVLRHRGPGAGPPR
jgi:hypothetical protein